jgi:outer membrane biosynthesis protein TonB
MNSARIDIETDRLGPAAQAPPRIDRRLPVVAALLCLVFACFFLIGRATRTGSDARSEAPSTLPVASVSAAIPVRLSDVQPIYVAAPAPPAPHPAPPRSAPAPERVAPAQTTASAPAPVSAPSAPAPSAPAPAPEPTRSFSPAPSEAPRPAPAPPSGGGSSGGGGGPTPSTGNGGSFDSSG